MPQRLGVMRCLAQGRANADSFEPPIDSAQHKSPCVSSRIIRQGLSTYIFDRDFSTTQLTDVTHYLIDIRSLLWIFPQHPCCTN